MPFEVYIDGACEPNPGGTASYGVLVVDQSLERYGEGPQDFNLVEAPVWEGKAVIGKGPEMSNNLAEYAALHAFLKWFSTQNTCPVKIKSDSQMLINQMIGTWHVSASKLYYPMWAKVDALIRKNSPAWRSLITWEWIAREYNLADRLSVEALATVGIKRRN